jgi:hypothetical protein
LNQKADLTTFSADWFVQENGSHGKRDICKIETVQQLIRCKRFLTTHNQQFDLSQSKLAHLNMPYLAEGCMVATENKRCQRNTPAFAIDDKISGPTIGDRKGSHDSLLYVG